MARPSRHYPAAQTISARLPFRLAKSKRTRAAWQARHMFNAFDDASNQRNIAVEMARAELFGKGLTGRQPAALHRVKREPAAHLELVHLFQPAIPKHGQCQNSCKSSPLARFVLRAAAPEACAAPRARRSSSSKTVRRQII